MNWYLLYVVATILIAPAFIYGIFTNYKIKSVFEFYSTKTASSGIRGSELASTLLTNAGATDVDVVHINGRLSDCYDSKRKVVKLSSSTYDSSSVSALGV